MDSGKMSEQGPLRSRRQPYSRTTIADKGANANFLFVDSKLAAVSVSFKYLESQLPILSQALSESLVLHSRVYTVKSAMFSDGKMIPLPPCFKNISAKMAPRWFRIDWPSGLQTFPTRYRLTIARLKMCSATTRRVKKFVCVQKSMAGNDLSFPEPPAGRPFPSDTGST
jgi:hypothetical protein